MSEEEDWFERALRESEDSGSEAEEESDGESEPEDGPEDDPEDDPESGADPGEPTAGDSPNDADVFAEDFASAMENAPSMGGDSGAAGGGFGEEVASADELTDLFDGETADFEEEEFDSDIPRIDVGIEGLDNMIQGGIPERSLMVAIGEAGTGKTTFGLQFAHHSLERGENAVFIALEETRERVINTADDKGWEFSTYVDRGQLAVLDLDPIEMANSLTSIRSELPGLVREFGASRLVLDSVSLLEMMYDSQATRRTQIYDFTQSLKDAGVTTMLTSESSEDEPHHSRFGIIEYLTDAVFVLRYIRPEDFRETRLAVEIQKIRDANHSREMKPYEITNEGISVYRQANIF